MARRYINFAMNVDRDWGNWNDLCTGTDISDGGYRRVCPNPKVFCGESLVPDPRKTSFGELRQVVSAKGDTMNKQSRDGIIRLKKEGLSNAEIAKNLNLKLATVIHYITLIRTSDDCPEWFRQSLNQRRKRIDDAIEDIMKELAAGISMEAVSEKYGASKKTIEERIIMYENNLVQDDECENEELRWIVEKAMIATIDQGKVLALARAGWKLKDIADELDVTEQVIKKVLQGYLSRQQGLKG